MRSNKGQLFVVAFDHRASFTRDLLGISGSVTLAEAARVSELKAIIHEGFLRALDEGAPRDAAGILVDEAFGSEVARRAHEAGVLLAMPVEKSGQQVFDFEYGEAFGAHIERFDPDFVKVLVRYNPEDPAGNAIQNERLRRLSDWLHARGRQFLFELLVPATATQMVVVGGDVERYDRELRPALMVRAIAELQAAGVEPDIWKIEGLDARKDYVRVVEQARADGRNGVVCIVLGRGASEARVTQWLRTAAPVPGFQGFAVGRTIWLEALAAYRDGLISREAAVERIAARYLRAIEVYVTTASGADAEPNQRAGLSHAARRAGKGWSVTTDSGTVQHPATILFDVDGCLISTGGAGARAWRHAFDRLYGIPADIWKFSEAGMTDPEVGRLTFARVLGREPTDRELARVLGAYLERLVVEVEQSPGYRVMPGVQTLLPRLVDAGVLLGIVSGALEAGAHIKLARAGLNRFFSFGAYGSDTRDRGELTRLAIDRAGRICGHPLDPAAVLVVGDTPRDASAAHAAGAVAVGVATGKYTLEELQAAGADHVLATLESPLPGTPDVPSFEEATP